MKPVSVAYTVELKASKSLSDCQLRDSPEVAREGLTIISDSIATYRLAYSNGIRERMSCKPGTTIYNCER